jgi:hypothetical protein
MKEFIKHIQVISEWKNGRVEEWKNGRLEVWKVKHGHRFRVEEA